MTPNRFKLVGLLVVTLIVTLLFLTPKNVAQEFTAHKLTFFDPDNFYQSIKEAENRGEHYTQKVYGGITPHDLFASSLIANFYSRFGNQKPKTIFLVGPNHREKGSSPVLTSAMAWETPFGNVEPDTKKIATLLTLGQVSVDETVLPEDHAVAGSMPFIKHFLPDSKVVPLLISGHLPFADMDRLVEALSSVMGESDIVVAAVDFSHYLRSEEARKNDQVTLLLMQERNYRALSLSGNDYLDSPNSIILLLKLMEKKGVSQLTVLENTNSGDIQKNENIETTSYFTAYFTK